MKNNIMLSICIPTYNRAKYLDICLQSIIHYKGTDIEVLIQDNNSPDDTAQIVSKFQDSRFNYEKNETNVGVRKNIRILFNKAQGDYVFCLTDDDYFLPGAIERVMNFIKTTNPVCFKSPLIMLLEKSKQSSCYKVYNDNKQSLFLFSHIFTGLCFNRQKLFEKYDENFNDNMYPSMVVMGLLLEEATYFDDVLTMHIWENEVFWGENMEPGSDNIHNHMIDLVVMLKEYISFELFKNIVIELCIRDRKIDGKFNEYLTKKEKISINSTILKLNLKNLVIKIGEKAFGKQ